MIRSFFAALCLLASTMRVGAQSDANQEPKRIPLRTHSLSQPYLDTEMSNRWWEFGGDVIIRADQYIRLAADVPSQSGWLFSRIPLTATNWEVEVEFSISGKGNLHGDGFAMWITKDKGQPGPVFGHKDQFEGLGIFFDTYKNNRPGVIFPYVMGMIGNGKDTYDAHNDGKANEIGGCSARGIRGASIPTKARVTYFQDKSLKLELQYKTESTWTECFTVNADNGREIRMPSTAYLGFSAHTGELSDNFDIISVDTQNLYYAAAGSGSAPRTAFSKAQQGAQSSMQPKSGGWGWFLFKIVLFIGVCVGGYLGFTAYRTRQRYSGF